MSSTLFEASVVHSCVCQAIPVSSWGFSGFRLPSHNRGTGNIQDSYTSDFYVVLGIPHCTGSTLPTGWSPQPHSYYGHYNSYETVTRKAERRSRRDCLEVLATSGWPQNRQRVVIPWGRDHWIYLCLSLHWVTDPWGQLCLVILRDELVSTKGAGHHPLG